MLMTNFHIGLEQVAEFQIALTLLSIAITFRFATLELHIFGATIVDEMRVGLIFSCRCKHVAKDILIGKR